MRELSALLHAWSNFYVMIGSAAAALTGVMFVVISLIRDSRSPSSDDGVAMFSTPTVVHFGYALFVAAVLEAPLPSPVPLAVLLGGAGAAGLAYVVRVAIMTAHLAGYMADAEDIVWHNVLPSVAYLTLVAGALGLHAAPALALYAPAIAVTMLIFIGIHNAWDVVTFIATGKAEALSQQRNGAEAKRA